MNKQYLFIALSLFFVGSVYADCSYWNDDGHCNGPANPTYECKTTGALDAFNYNACHGNIDDALDSARDAYDSGTYYRQIPYRFAACTYIIYDTGPVGLPPMRYTWCNIYGTWQKFIGNDPNFCLKNSINLEMENTAERIRKNSEDE
ncbi:MAG: hypothetical protein SVR94_16765 [Pseudomonadota bacterium]|nr:hypothetical protein [Pseudomonadota bacterium]